VTPASPARYVRTSPRSSARKSATCMGTAGVCPTPTPPEIPRRPDRWCVPRGVGGRELRVQHRGGGVLPAGVQGEGVVCGLPLPVRGGVDGGGLRDEHGGGGPRVGRRRPGPLVQSPVVQRGTLSHEK